MRDYAAQHARLKQNPSYVEKKRERARARAARIREQAASVTGWPLLDAFRKADDKRAVIRASLETWRRE